MVASVVDDHRQLLSAPIFPAEEVLQESMEGHPVELIRFRFDAQAASSKVDCAPVANLRPGRCRGNLWLRTPRPPHTNDAGTLLKVNLVFRIDPDLRILQQADQFFLKSACLSGSAPFGYVRGRSKRMPRS